MLQVQRWQRCPTIQAHLSFILKASGCVVVTGDKLVGGVLTLGRITTIFWAPGIVEVKLSDQLKTFNAWLGKQVVPEGRQTQFALSGNYYIIQLHQTNKQKTMDAIYLLPTTVSIYLPTKTLIILICLLTNLVWRASPSGQTKTQSKGKRKGNLCKSWQFNVVWPSA